MSRLLFTLWDGGGNVPPVVSLAGALSARGHEVAVLADLSLEETVTSSGARHLPWTTAPQRSGPDPSTEFVRDFEPGTPLGASARIRDRLIVDPAANFARDTLEAIRQQGSEAVISENLLLGCQIAATSAGVPSVSVVPNIYPGKVPGVPPFGLGLKVRTGPVGRIRDGAAAAMGRRLWDRRLSDVNDLLDEYGQPRLSTLLEMLERPDRVLVLTTAAFELGGGVNAPANVRYCGPRIEDPDWTGAWEEPEGPGPLVLASLSTTTQGQDPMIRHILGALGELPVRGLVTTGPSFSATDLKIPENVTVVPSAPHAAVMPHADAVISHAGHGTVIKSLAFGVPLLCLPVGRDQPDTAARVVACGAGLRLRPGARSAAIASALDRILSEPDFREAAGRVAEAIEADRQHDLAVEEIEHLVATRSGLKDSEPGG